MLLKPTLKDTLNIYLNEMNKVHRVGLFIKKQKKKSIKKNANPNLKKKIGYFILHYIFGHQVFTFSHSSTHYKILLLFYNIKNLMVVLL